MDTDAGGSMSFVEIICIAWLVGVAVLIFLWR